MGFKIKLNKLRAKQAAATVTESVAA